MVGRKTPARRLLLPSNPFRTGITFLRSVHKRHADKLSLFKPLHQEEKRFLAVNAEVLSMHFVTLEKLISEHSLNADRIYNLDETGVSPDKDVTGSRCKLLMTRHGSRDAQMPAFKRLNRVTMTPIFSQTNSLVLLYLFSKPKNYLIAWCLVVALFIVKHWCLSCRWGQFAQLERRMAVLTRRTSAIGHSYLSSMYVV